ncbi:MAG TPA: acetyl-CoA C-acetyltransferase [Pseudomonadales bacterium]
MASIHIVAACRTPVGRLNGALAALPAHELGASVIRGCLERAHIDAAGVGECILGQVLTAGAGMNPARQAARAAGIPDAAPAFGVNQVCGSGMRAVALAFQQLRCGEADVIIAGGQESMSRAPHVAHMRGAHKLGDVTLADTVLLDGLTDAFHGCAMGVTAEALANRYALSRDEQDAWALRSQQRASAACTSGRFAREIVAVAAGARVVDKDEHIRHDSTLQSLAKPAPAFAADGTVTAANASGINDGAAAVLLMHDDALRTHGATSLARVVSWASTGVEPMLMGLGPVSAVNLALQRAGWQRDDVDLWEINEAFAAQVLAVLRELRIDPERVNVDGGAIALGHPIGASGARVLVTLVHALQARGKRRGVAALCIGGGMGIAMCVERA